MVFIVILIFIAGCLYLGFKVRPLASKTLEVSSGNKHPQRPMKWYEDRIREQIRDLRFKSAGIKDGVETFTPTTLYKVYEPNIYLEVTPYTITVSASRLMIRLIATYIEIPE